MDHAPPEDWRAANLPLFGRSTQRRLLWGLTSKGYVMHHVLECRVPYPHFYHPCANMVQFLANITKLVLIEH